MRQVRVAVVFDGNNIYHQLRMTNNLGVDYGRMVQWITQCVGNAEEAIPVLVGVHYYTAVTQNGGSAASEPDALQRFLNGLEMQPGFFVHRFPQRVVTKQCPSCGAQHSMAFEKGVDTSITADVLLWAGRECDIVVLITGDADLKPAVEAIPRFGAKAYLAFICVDCVARELRSAAFAAIDLKEGLCFFKGGSPPASDPPR